METITNAKFSRFLITISQSGFIRSSELGRRTITNRTILVTEDHFTSEIITQPPKQQGNKATQLLGSDLSATISFTPTGPHHFRAEFLGNLRIREQADGEFGFLLPRI